MTVRHKARGFSNGKSESQIQVYATPYGMSASQVVTLQAQWELFLVMKCRTQKRLSPTLVNPKDNGWSQQ